MTGEITPRQFGERLEAAAENDRRRKAEPNRVEYRHPFAGSLLLLGIIGTAACLLLARGGRPAWLPWSRPKVAAVVPPATAADGRRDDGRYQEPNARNAAPKSEGDAGSFGRLRASVGLTFIGPAFFLYAALVVLPAASAMLWAFTRWDGLGPRTWAGTFHFRSLLFENDTIWQALRNNVFLMVVPALVVVPIALLFAHAIHRGVAGGKLFRIVFLFPNMLGGIAATLLWLNAYEPHGGLINATLVAFGDAVHSDWLRSFDGFAWLTPNHLYGALVPIYLWMACGFNLILYLAAMEGIDPQLYEAAELDGAPAWRQFFTITLPLIWDVIGISAVFLVIAGLNAFEMVWLLTAQEPDSSTHTLSTLLVTTMFKYFDVGRATALAVLLLALVLVASGAVLRALKRDAVEQ